jgi:recombination protein RecR
MFSSLPGIGKKSATRIAHYILKKEKAYAETLARQLVLVKDSIRACSECGNYTEENPCPICTDPGRDRSLMCVVEQPQDVQTIEDTNEYHGLFHVLGGAISPIDGIGPKELTFDKLRERIGRKPIREIIIATNPTVEGDTTALYIVKLFSGSGITLTRLASGIPVGGDLEYADRMTLARSLKGRVPYSF